VIPDGDIAIQAQDLTRRFGRFTAVDVVSFQIHRGEVFGLLGANGAGKTTTIRMLTGLLRPTGGEAWVVGVPVHSTPEAVKSRLGYMSQKFSLYEDLTVRENLTFFGGAYGLRRRELANRRSELLELFDLSEWADRITGSLPTGHRQRLALASALIHEPPLLFLDEPTGGIDPVSRRNFWRVISDLASAGATIMVTTHYMDEAEYCHRLGIMRAGRIEAVGSPGELRTTYEAATMEEVFLSVAAPEEAL
jgi:ABC-2 type transport system ATP-binding protein